MYAVLLPARWGWSGWSATGSSTLRCRPILAFGSLLAGIGLLTAQRSCRSPRSPTPDTCWPAPVSRWCSRSCSTSPAWSAGVATARRRGRSVRHEHRVLGLLLGPPAWRHRATDGPVVRRRFAGIIAMLIAPAALASAAAASARSKPSRIRTAGLTTQAATGGPVDHDET